MRERVFAWSVVLAVLLAGSLVYLNTFDGDWVWDDVSSVILHRHVQAPARLWHGEAVEGQQGIAGSVAQLFREDQHAFGRGQGNFYRPLLSLSFAWDFFLSYDPALDRPAGGGHLEVSPFVFHLSSLLWHLLAAWMLFGLLSRLGAPRFVRAAVPLVYVVHPLHTEAVAYISGRADMMSAALMFAALFLALERGGLGRRGVAWVLSTMCFVGALLSKESSAIYPLLLVLVLLGAPVRGEEGQAARRAYWMRAFPAAAALVVFAGYIALRMTVLTFAEGGGGAASPLGQRLVETAQAFAFYIRVLFVPTGLHMEQTLDGAPLWMAGLGFALLAGCVAFLVLSVVLGQRRAALGLAWFLVGWLPISGVFPLNAPMAEHWMYVPMAGFWWCLAEWANRLADGKRPSREAALAWPRAVVVALTFLLFVSLLGLAVGRNRDWHSNETIFRATVAENPDTARVHYNLAVTYEDLLHNYPGARRHYERALLLYARQRPPGSGQLLDAEVEIALSLGRVLVREGAYTEAIPHLVRGASAGSGDAMSASRGAEALGQAFLALGYVGQAHAYLQQAALVAPPRAPAIEATLNGAAFPGLQ